MTSPAAGADTCGVCRRGEAPVCDRCRARMAAQLGELPGMSARLALALVPGSAGSERVSSTTGEAPMPARLAALTLVAGGSDDARCLFIPAVRIWTTVEVVIPMRPVIRWHRELVRDSQGRAVMTLADDQSGVLPLREWLRAWAREWRRTLGHSIDDWGPPPRLIARMLANPGRKPLDLIADFDRDDPVAREWDQRWPATGWGPATRRHYAYLTTWLDQACDRVSHISDFAASLRTLTGAVRAALGDVDDLEYLGRCPEEIESRTGGAVTICGAGIWHDPYASVITCPRCHTETSQDRRIWLARRILDVWPIDRRRRYPLGLIDVLRKPVCATCAAPVAVHWIDATERADRERFWRPGILVCPTGCEVVG